MARKPDHSIRWSKRERALLYSHQGEKPTNMLLAHFIEGVTLGDAYNYPGRERRAGDERTLAQELEARGYDLTTLKFFIRKKITT